MIGSGDVVDPKGPWVIFACLLDSYAVQPDGRLDLIGVHDQVSARSFPEVIWFTLSVMAVVDGPEQPLAVRIKGGGHTSPSMPVKVPLDAAGPRIVLDQLHFSIPIEAPGQYWFEIVSGERVVTRVPMSVVLDPTLTKSDRPLD